MINLAPTTKEALTEKLKHYFLTLGNLNALDVPDDDHTKLSEDITSAFIDTLLEPTVAEPAPAPSKPLGYVVGFRKENGTLTKSIYTDEFYPSEASAQRAINTHTSLHRDRYEIIPVHAS